MLTIKRKKLLFIELFIAFAILYTTFMVYFHVWCPNSDRWVTSWYDISLPDDYTFISFCLVFLITLTSVFFFAIWYFTCKYWWRFSLLILFGLSVYRFESVITYELELGSISKNVIELGIVFGAMFLLHWISVRINYPLKNRLMNDSIDADKILKYRVKSSKQYTRMLNALQNEAHKSDLSNAKEIVAKAVLVCRFDKKKHRLGTNSEDRTLGSYIVVFLLLSIPFIDRIHRLFPEGVKEYDFGFFTLESFGFYSLDYFLWIVGIKITLFMALTIWFLTCSYWWKYFLLVPLTIVTYQIFSTFNVQERELDENEIWYALPVLAVLLTFLLWVSFKIGNYNKIQHLKDKIKVEIFKIISFLANEKEDDDYESAKMELKEVMMNKDQYKPEDYLKRLEELQTKLAQKNTL